MRKIVSRRATRLTHSCRRGCAFCGAVSRHALVLLTESGLIDRRAAGAVGVAYVWGIANWAIANGLAARQLRAIWPEGGWLLNEQRLTVDGDGITSEAIRKGLHLGHPLFMACLQRRLGEGRTHPAVGRRR